jgi:hypothetical protein
LLSRWPCRKANDHFKRCSTRKSEARSRGAIAKYALDQAKRQLPVLGFVAREKALEAGRDLAHLEPAPTAQLLGDVGGNILRPALSGVEADDADGVRILAVEQALDDGLEVGCLDISFAIGAPAPDRNRSRPGRRLDPRHRAQSRESNLCHP